jgi:hypothetical protein
MPIIKTYGSDKKHATEIQHLNYFQVYLQKMMRKEDKNLENSIFGNKIKMFC